MSLSSTRGHNWTVKRKAKRMQGLDILGLGGIYVIPKALYGCCISMVSYALYQKSETSSS